MRSFDGQVVVVVFLFFLMCMFVNKRRFDGFMLVLWSLIKSLFHKGSYSV